MRMSASTTQSHRRLLQCLSLATRVSTFLLIHVLSSVPLFDSSPSISSTGSKASPLLRWDAFHFAHIAQSGYVHEYEWAFFPGTPLVMRIAGEILRFVKGKWTGTPGPVIWDDLLQGGALAACLCDIGSTTTLYNLTLHHLGSPNLALIASVLSLLPSSPATLRFAAYSEPFFTYLSYKGMLSCARSQWFHASVYFALAGTFRSNGILLGGFILWDLIINPFLHRKHVSFPRLLYSVILTAITFTPFVYHHVSAYITYCISPDPPSNPPSHTPPTWCTALPPSIYTHIQSKYWKSGFMHYWNLSQLPNFVISLPVFLLLIGFCGYHIISVLFPQLRCFVFPNSTPPSRTTIKRDGPPHLSHFLSPTITPHAIHAFILTLTILLNSHVQIILRQAASMPITYWAGAWLVVEDAGGDGDEESAKWTRGRWGRWWVGWSFIWGMVSLVLWVAFLPPA